MSSFPFFHDLRCYILLLYKGDLQYLCRRQTESRRANISQRGRGSSYFVDEGGGAVSYYGWLVRMNLTNFIITKIQKIIQDLNLSLLHAEPGW